MPSLTQKDLRFLESFRELLEFGGGLFNNQSFQLPQQESFYKRNFLLLTFGAIHNYAETVYILCKNMRPQAAIVLLRSIFEAYLNMHYLMNVRSNKRLALYVVKDVREHIKIVNSFLSLIKRHPRLENKYGMTTKATLDAMKKKHEDIEASMRSLNKIPITLGLKSLEERAREYDRRIGSKARKGEMEFNYHLLYRQFSSCAHLTPTGLQEFIKDTPEGREFILDQSEKIEPVVTTTFQLYLNLLKYLDKWKLISKDISFKKFNRILKEMNRSLEKRDLSI